MCLSSVHVYIHPLIYLALILKHYHVLGVRDTIANRTDKLWETDKQKINEFIEIMPSSLNKQSDVIEENWGGRRMLDEGGWSRKTSLSR